MSQLIGPDLEEADRQATLFQVLRAVMSRKFVAPEIYDLMNKVAEMLVTNQSSNVREVCRAIYLQFLLDYPQGRGRLKDSLAFLAKNLSYTYESGRLSVLELVSAVLSKFASNLVQDSADLFFISLVMVIANDDSTRCREMAAELVKLLFSRVDKDTRDTLLGMLHSWSGKKTQPQLARTAVQLLGVAVDGLGEEGKSSAPAIVDVLLDILVDSEEKLEQAELEGGEAAAELEAEWQLPYQSIQSLSHVYKAFPDLVSPDDKSSFPLWRAVRGHLLYPHIWLRSSSARLLGTLYGASASSVSTTDLPEHHPLATPNLLDAAQKACLQLKSPLLDDSLAMQIVKNLFFAAKCFAARSDNTSNGADEANEEEETADADEQRKADPLKWLFTRLSYQTRQAHMLRPSRHDLNAVRLVFVSSFHVLTSSFSRRVNGLVNRRAFSAGSPPASASSMPPSSNASSCRWRFPSFASRRTRMFRTLKWVRSLLSFLLLPSSSLTFPPIAVELQTLAREVQELLQTKIGTTKYSAVHNEIRAKAAARRNERKQATALMVRVFLSLSSQHPLIHLFLPSGPQRPRRRRSKEGEARLAETGAEEEAHRQLQRREGASWVEQCEEAEGGIGV
jgi:U3 small nucleolar RNA-associated protein 20